MLDIPNTNNIQEWSFFLAWICNKLCHKNFQKTKDYVENQTLQTKRNKKQKFCTIALNYSRILSLLPTNKNMGTMLRSCKYKHGNISLKKLIPHIRKHKIKNTINIINFIIIAKLVGSMLGTWKGQRSQQQKHIKINVWWFVMHPLSNPCRDRCRNTKNPSSFCTLVWYNLYWLPSTAHGLNKDFQARNHLLNTHQTKIVEEGN